MKPAPFYAEIAEGPENGAAFWVSTDDGLRLRIAFWGKETASNGTTFLFPGRTEYIELQGHTARDFVDLGYAVLVIDWRGHGLSDRILSNRDTLHVDQFADYQLDVAAMVKAATDIDMPRPWFLLGNSMGGCIGLRALIEGLPVAACAFTAPMWSLKMSAFQRAIALPFSSAAHAIGKGEKYVPGHDGKNYVTSNPFEGNRITQDNDNYDYWVRQAHAKPCLQTAGSSMRWLQQSLLECRSLSKMPSPNVPCIAFCGELDELVDIDVISRRIEPWRNGRFERFPDAKHALLLEVPAVRNKLLNSIMEHFAEFSAAVGTRSLHVNS